MARLRPEDIFDLDDPDQGAPRAAEHPDLRRRSARGAVWVMAGNWGSRVISTVVVFVLAHVLGPESFGIVAIATLAVLVLQIVVDGGFSTALVQLRGVGRVHYDTAFWTSVVTGVVMTAVGLLLAAPLAAFFREPQVEPVMRVLAVTLFIGSLGSIPLAVLQRRMQYASLAARLLVANVVGGTVGIVLALNGFGVWSLVVQTVVKELVTLVVVWIACPVLPRLHVTREAFGSMFRFGLNITGTYTMTTLNKRSDDFLVGRFMGAEMLGFYNVAYQFLMLLNQLLNQTIATVAFPLFARLQDDKERLRNALHEVTRLSSVVTLPAFCALCALAPDIVLVFFGPQWGPSVPVMRVLALVGLPMTVGYFLTTLMNGSGHANWEFRLNVIQTVTLVLAFFAAVQFGLVAVAASLVVVWTVFVPVRLVLVRKFLPIDIGAYLKQFLPPLAATVAMFFVMLGLQAALVDVVGPVVRLLVAGGAGLVVYVAGLALVGRRHMRDALSAAGHVLPGRVGRRLLRSGTV